MWWTIRTAVIAARQGSTQYRDIGAEAPAFVAAARLSVERLGVGS